MDVCDASTSKMAFAGDDGQPPRAASLGELGEETPQKQRLGVSRVERVRVVRFVYRTRSRRGSWCVRCVTGAGGLGRAGPRRRPPRINEGGVRADFCACSTGASGPPGCALPRHPRVHVLVLVLILILVRPRVSLWHDLLLDFSFVLVVRFFALRKGGGISGETDGRDRARRRGHSGRARSGRAGGRDRASDRSGSSARTHRRVAVDVVEVLDGGVGRDGDGGLVVVRRSRDGDVLCRGGPRSSDSSRMMARTPPRGSTSCRYGSPPLRSFAQRCLRTRERRA